MRAERVKATTVTSGREARLRRDANARGRAARVGGHPRDAPYDPLSADAAWWYEGFDRAPSPPNPPQETIEQARQRVVLSYRQAGYTVYADALPPLAHLDFLQSWQPVLVAEGRDEQGQPDRVVIEIRSSRALRGAVDFMALVETVTAQPGWRLELVAVAHGP